MRAIVNAAEPTKAAISPTKNPATNTEFSSFSTDNVRLIYPVHVFILK